MFFPLKGREKKEAEFSENAMFHPLEKNIFPSCTKTLFETTETKIYSPRFVDSFLP